MSELEELQLSKLRRQVGYLAVRSPFYRRDVVAAHHPRTGGAMQVVRPEPTLVPPETIPRSELQTALIRIDSNGRRP